jgi:hypothetical protein
MTDRDPDKGLVAADEATDAAVLSLVRQLPPASDDRGPPGHDAARAGARRIDAVQLRLAGLTYEQIAAQAGYHDKSAARHAVLRALDRVEHAAVDDLRVLENARLDRAQAAIWPAVLRGELAAVNSFLRLSERRARLNGLDAPVRVSVADDTKAQIDALLVELTEVVAPDGTTTYTDRADGRHTGLGWPE